MKEFAYKILGRKYTWLAREYNQAKTIAFSFMHPYHYDAERYSDTFLSINGSVKDNVSLKPIDRVIYIFWTGDNNITPNRLLGVDSLKKVCGVDVKLITPQNLNEYIKKEDPLPEAYQYLSLVHKADYLRSYFMCYYGGGYADIKTYYKSWVPAFDKLDRSGDSYVLGYSEVGFDGADYLDMENQNLKYDLRYHWRYLVGNGAYICRPYTKFTQEWHYEANRRLEHYSRLLKQHPAQDIYGKTGDYPIPWSKLLGQIFHPLCLKYNDKILKDNNLKPSFKNYR